MMNCRRTLATPTICESWLGVGAWVVCVGGGVGEGGVDVAGWCSSVHGDTSNAHDPGSYDSLM